MALALSFGGAPLIAAIWFYAGTDWSELASRLPRRATWIFVGTVFFAAVVVARRGVPRFSLDRTTGILGLIFIAAALVGLMRNTIDPQIALYSFLPKALHLAAGIPLLFVLGVEDRRLPRMLIVGFLVGLGMHAVLTLGFIDALAQHEGHNLVFSPPGMFHIRAWGMLLTCGVACGLGLCLDMSGSSRWLLIVMLACLSALMFCTGTRAAPIALLASAAFSAMLFRQADLRWFMLACGVIVAGAALSLTLPVPHPSWGLFNSVAESTSAATLDTLSAGRLKLWQQTVELISQKPLLGHGYHQFSYLRAPPYETFTHPHNAPLNFLLSFGLIGGGALIALLLLLWKRAIRRTLDDPSATRIAAFTALNALLALSVVGGVFFRLETLMALAVFWSIAIAKAETVDRL